MIKEKIIELYFSEHIKVKNISEKLSISSAYVTKVIKKDARYLEEKLYRKECSKNKRRIDQKKFAKNKREKRKFEDNYQIVKKQHEQAAMELSKTKHLSNENYRKWNITAYKFNPSKNRYEFDEKLGRSYDVPKYIKNEKVVR